ncbi:MAG: Mur ligase family protein [Thermoplasmatota archaeon]
MSSALEWLQGLKQRGIRLGLERIGEVLRDIDLPGHVVRVGGTNGKGSVCALLGGILRQTGATVGVYTSPELERVNERVTVNGDAIGDRDLARHAAWLMKHDVELTFFEALTAIALRYFSQRCVDYAVLEVGMGGRYDATAAVNADVTVVTNVSFDHMEHLGQSIEAIAGEIAGAIRGGIVVTACTGTALDIVKQRAIQRGARLHVVSRDMWQQTGPGGFRVTTERRYDLETRLAGAYQGQNIALAVQTAEVLGVDRRSIIDGVAGAWLPGRLERLGNIMLDGAHNPAAMQALRVSLENMDIRPRYIVFGAMRDKDIPGIIAELPPGDVIATAAPTTRAASGAEIAGMLSEMGRNCHVATGPADALRKARAIAGEGDVILVTGSLCLVGDIRRHLH